MLVSVTIFWSIFHHSFSTDKGEMWNGNHLFFMIFKTSQFFLRQKIKNIKMCVYFKDALDFADIFSLTLKWQHFCMNDSFYVEQYIINQNSSISQQIFNVN